VRYKITDSNVRIEHTEEETEALVAASFAVFVPRLASKLYFLCDDDSNYPQLRSLAETNRLFRMVRRDQDHQTIIKHFRIVETNVGLCIAPNTSEKLDRTLWSELCEKIDEQSRKFLQDQISERS